MIAKSYIFSKNKTEVAAMTPEEIDQEQDRIAREMAESGRSPWGSSVESDSGRAAPTTPPNHSERKLTSAPRQHTFIASSALNRKHRDDRIAKENQEIVKRLQSVKSNLGRRQ